MIRMKRPCVRPVRRLFWASVAFSPLAVAIASVVFGTDKPKHANFFGIGFVAVGALVAAINFYLSFIRFPLYIARHHSKKGFQFVSGIPMIGSICIISGVLSAFGSVDIALVGVAAFVLDTGGSGWFIVSTWRDGSLWS